MMPHDKLPPSLQTTLRKEEEENPPFSNRIWVFLPFPLPNNLANCTKKLISQSALSLALALREWKAGGGSCIFCLSVFVCLLLLFRCRKIDQCMLSLSPQNCASSFPFSVKDECGGRRSKLACANMLPSILIHFWGY